MSRHSDSADGQGQPRRPDRTDRRSFRAFLSAASHELASYRAEVARVLRRKELDVRDQEHFRQGGATLIEHAHPHMKAALDGSSSTARGRWSR